MPLPKLFFSVICATLLTSSSTFAKDDHAEHAEHAATATKVETTKEAKHEEHKRKASDITGEKALSMLKNGNTRYKNLMPSYFLVFTLVCQRRLYLTKSWEKFL